VQTSEGRGSDGWWCGPADAGGPAYDAGRLTMRAGLRCGPA